MTPNVYPKPKEHLGPEQNIFSGGFLAPCPLLHLPLEMGLPALCLSPSLRLGHQQTWGTQNIFQCKHLTTIKLYLPISCTIFIFFSIFIHYKPHDIMLNFSLEAVTCLLKTTKKGKVLPFYIYWYFTIIGALHPFFYIWVSIWCHFSSFEKLPLTSCEMQVCSSLV